MPIRSEIQTEINRDGTVDYDGVRRKYLNSLYQITQRPIILYGSAWVQKPNCNPSTILINDEDIQALMEVMHGIEGNELDIILHSPGGSPEATEAIVTYLRSRFSNIRVIVPHKAMSAGTLLACSANSVILGKHSFLGPTDPQFPISTPLGPRLVPAQAVLDQFDLAKRECVDPRNLDAWKPMLHQYGPAFLIQCENALNMTRELASNWLKRYMFGDDQNAEEKAIDIADWLCDHTQFNSHNRHISRNDLKSRGFLVKELEEKQDLQDAVLSVYHSMALLFEGTQVAKIVENHLGRGFIKIDTPLKNL